jgi:hypothetical protein
VFFQGRPLQPCLIFMGKASSLPYGQTPFSLNRLARDKKSIICPVKATNSKSWINLTPCANFVELFSSSLTDELQWLSLTSLCIAAKIWRWGLEPPTLRVERLGFGLAFSLVQHIIILYVKMPQIKHSSLYRRTVSGEFRKFYDVDTFANSLPPSVTVSSWN